MTISKMRRFQQAKTCLKVYQRFYCDKPPKNIKIDVEKSGVIVEKEATADTSAECAKLEEQVVKQDLLEKEQDANLQSRLAKDCKLLFSRSSDQLSDKHVSAPPEIIEVDVEKSGIIVGKEATAECAKFEEQVVKQDLLKKEQDANLQSRLAKDCKLLFSRSSNQLTDKHFSASPESIKVDVDKSGVIVKKDATADSSAECVKFEEQVVVKQDLLEKEQDANLQSRLAKDCKLLFSRSSDQLTDKHFTAPSKSIEVAVEKSGIIVEKEATADSSEECAKFKEQVVKQALLEKERDAILQSRLAKDCKLLFSRSSNHLTDKHFSAIRLDQMALPKDAAKPTNTDDLFKIYLSDMSFQQTLDKLPASKSTTEVTDKTTAAGDSGGKKSGGNRPMRQEPGKVLLTFIPEEWWYALMPKTGVTGLGTFMFTFGIFALSKEYYVLEHAYYHGLSAFIMWALAIKYLGPETAKYLDKKLDAYEAAWNEGRVQHKAILSESILDELQLQYQMDGQQMMMDAKRENVQLQLEEEYRKRLMHAYNEVKNRLDYHVAVELVKQRIQHRNLIEYVTTGVTKAITPELQDKLIYYSIDRIVEDLDKIKGDK